MNKSEKKAVGLLSGGLDSSLAVRVISDLGYKVTAINYETPFCNCATKITCGKTDHTGADEINFRRFFAGPEYIELVKNPPHGYGKNMNICIDCRLFMLKKAKQVMEEIQADFVFTGEVLGQRPLSQKRKQLNIIEEESGLKGRLLRPLSAKLLEPIDVEKDGRLNREKLFCFVGRNRKPQMELAEELGISEYPSPAGGCLLTEKEFVKKLRDAFEHGEDTFKDIMMLKNGRHYRMEDGSKIIAGRTKVENDTLTSLSDDNTTIFTVIGYSSTYCFLFGDPSEKNINFAGSVSARYSKVKDRDSVSIKWWTGKSNSESYKEFAVSPADSEMLNRYKV